MSDTNSRLWPYSVVLALAAAPAIFALVAALIFSIGALLQWPALRNESAVLYFSIALSLLPLLLVLLDFVALKRAVIGNKWLNLDFSKAIAEGGPPAPNSFALPDNIIAEQDRLMDSDGKRMIAAMKRATTAEIVYLDLKDGNAWWVTRLLTLCVGAQGIGATKAIVFVGTKDNKQGIFLGWGDPGSLLRAMLKSNSNYNSRFQRAGMIAGQLAIFGVSNEALLPRIQAPPPVATPTLVLHPIVQTAQSYFDEDESVMRAKITLEQLRSAVDQGATPKLLPNLEEPPDRLTVVRLQELFVACLCTDAIDRTWPNSRQLDQFLESSARYVALVRNGAYEGMLRSDLGERAVLRELFRQSQKVSANAGGA